MSESAALLVDEVLPHEPIRQWVLSFPFQLRFLFASRPELMGKALGIVHRAIASHLVKKAGKTQKTAQTGSVTLIQRFGRSGAPGALNLNVHFHMLFLDPKILSSPLPSIKTQHNLTLYLIRLVVMFEGDDSVGLYP